MSVELAALLISALAFVLSSWAAWNSHRQANESRRQANAAEDQVTMMLEEQNAADARQEALNDRPWSLMFYNGDAYELTNLGSLTAYDLSVEGGARADWRDAPEDNKLGPGESALVFIVLGAGSSRKLAVRWATEPGGEMKEMTLLIPPK